MVSKNISRKIKQHQDSAKGNQTQPIRGNNPEVKNKQQEDVFTSKNKKPTKERQRL